MRSGTLELSPMLASAVHTPRPLHPPAANPQKLHARVAPPIAPVAAPSHLSTLIGSLNTQTRMGLGMAAWPGAETPRNGLLPAQGPVTPSAQIKLPVRLLQIRSHPLPRPGLAQSWLADPDTRREASARSALFLKASLADYTDGFDCDQTVSHATLVQTGAPCFASPRQRPPARTVMLAWQVRVMAGAARAWGAALPAGLRQRPLGFRPQSNFV
jgi:hypothetical protein